MQPPPSRAWWTASAHAATLRSGSTWHLWWPSIRRKQVIGDLGLPLSTDITHFVHAEQPPLTRLVVQAWQDEPGHEERPNILSMIGQTDLGLRGPVLCALLPSAQGTDRSVLSEWVRTALAHSESTQETAPREAVACARPFLEDLFTPSAD